MSTTRQIKSKTFQMINGIVQSDFVENEEEIICDNLQTPPPPPPPTASPVKPIRCSHILIKHKDSAKPTSWRDNTKIIRNRNEALKLIEYFRNKIIEAAQSRDSWLAMQGTFENIALKYSECSSAKSGGDLNFFTTGQMQYDFEQAAFSLSVGGLSQPIFTESGVHLILRTA